MNDLITIQYILLPAYMVKDPEGQQSLTQKIIRVTRK